MDIPQEARLHFTDTLLFSGLLFNSGAAPTAKGCRCSSRQTDPCQGGEREMTYAPCFVYIGCACWDGLYTTARPLCAVWSHMCTEYHKAVARPGCTEFWRTWSGYALHTTSIVTCLSQTHTLRSEGRLSRHLCQHGSTRSTVHSEPMLWQQLELHWPSRHRATSFR
eukprot:2153596-Pyramimonas_sp.AAC.1